MLLDQAVVAPFETFFGCMSLRTGSLVIGIVGLWDLLLIVGWRYSALSIVGLVSSLALIYGACKSNRNYVWPYLIVKLLTIIVLIVLVLIMMIAPEVLGCSFTLVTKLGLLILLYCLCFWFVYSFNYELRQTEIAAAAPPPEEL